LILSKSSVSSSKSSSIVVTFGFCSGCGSDLCSVIFATSLSKSSLFSNEIPGFGEID